MPKRKKKAQEMTDEELKRRIFPKKVLGEIRRIAHEGEDKDEQPKPEPNNSSHG